MAPKAWRLAAPLLLVSSCTPVSRPVWAAPEGLRIASEGASDYVIVTPTTPTAVDTYAVAQLARYLKQATAADLPVVAPEAWNPGQPAIFVGISAPVVQRFGADPVFLPTTRARDMKETHVVDPDAAFGYAVRVHKLDMPFQIGFYQWRNTEDLAVDYVWAYLYITKAPAGHISKVWFDNIVVASEYIGPMER